MIGELWGVLVVCLGAAGGEPCQTHHFGPFDGYSCPRAVAALKVELATTHGQCLAVPPTGSTPLPATTGGAIHAQAAQARTAGIINAAASRCGDRGQILKQLAQGHNEMPEALGLSSDGGVLEVLVSPAGSWTILVTYPERPTCVIAVGTAWEALRPLVGVPANLEQ